MQAQIDPTLQIIPFDDKFAVKAEIKVEKQSQKLFLMKTFMMFVLEIRSAMDTQCIRTLKRFILQTCQDLLQKGGIDNIGFVINKNYHTIRNPNYEGIKDLLNLNVKVDDTSDIRQTLICLRNSIQAQAKKMQQAKISIFMFTSNVQQNPLNPMKSSYRAKLNAHIGDYQKQIKRLRNTISEYCDDCYFYSIGYIKKFNNDKIQNGYQYYNKSNNQGIDAALLYKISSICKRKQFSFNICNSYPELQDKFKQVSALITYDFHQFCLMVPVRKTDKLQYTVAKTIQKKKSSQKQQINVKEQIIEQQINQQQLEQFIQKNRKQMKEQQYQQDIQSQQQQIDYLPQIQGAQQIKYAKLDLTNLDQTKFSTQNYMYFDRTQLNLQQLHKNGYHLFKKTNKKQQLKFPQKKKILKKLVFIYTPQYFSKKVNYHQPNSIQLIKCQSNYYASELGNIIYKISTNILSYKKRFVGMFKNTRIFETYLQVDQDLQHKLRQRVFQIQKIIRQMYEKVFKDQLIKSQKQKRSMYELYSSLKTVLDTTKQVFASIYKKQIKNEDICKLSTAMNYDKIKSSLKRKLIKRVNSNPRMIDQVYDRVQNICTNQIGSYVDLQAKYRYEKSEVGNCMYTFRNFAGCLKQRDCLAVIFQIQRPDAAIADPGRIRIRQVSTYVTSVQKFFQVHLYYMSPDYQQLQRKILQAQQRQQQQKQRRLSWWCPCCITSLQQQMYTAEVAKEIQIEKQKQKQMKMNIQQNSLVKQQQNIRQMKQDIKFGIKKQDYFERWDYWNKVQSKQTHFGIMPLYICEQNWKVAKQLMKPSMGWTACGQPLGYTYSQTQTIPFMVLSNLIRSIQQIKYKIQQMSKQAQKVSFKKQYEIQYQINMLKHKKQRLQNLLKHTQLTCNAIMKDMSSPNIQQPLNKVTIQKYINYEKPINRTVDIINNNSSFISQLYTVIKLGYMQKPSQQKFHQFFKRLIQEELRRETDGWNQQQVQDSFVNKLLNVKVEQMDKPHYMVMQSEYLDKFQIALKGQQVHRTEFQIQRAALQMIIKENNTFNNTQRMSIIQYKRLYENRVLWLWYVRFRLYQQKQRIAIHKWKCIDLTNSYQLFAMIIQNKKQRKNYKRRLAIQNGQYVDPFDYYQARPFLQNQFIKMRNKKQQENIVLLHAQKYGKASRVFARSKDLRQAAGAAMNIYVGKQIKYYYSQLLDQSQFMQEKLKMLLNGEFQGVQLFKHGWKMSNKRMNRLRQKYPYQFMKYQYMF